MLFGVVVVDYLRKQQELSVVGGVYRSVTQGAGAAILGQSSGHAAPIEQLKNPFSESGNSSDAVKVESI